MEAPMFDVACADRNEDDDHRETWPTPPPTLPSGTQRVARRSCIDLITWIHLLRSDETTRPVALDDVLDRALVDGAAGAHVVRQITCSAALDAHSDRLTRFFAGIIADVVADTAATGPSARTILLRVDVEGPRSVVVEIADLRRVVGAATTMDETDAEAIEIVRASDAMLGITVSADRDPTLGMVVRVELPAHPRR